MQDKTFLEIFDKKDFRNWLFQNHDKEIKINLILHKKHTKKSSPGHKELMEEAICFGWIDTTVKRLDNDRYIRTFVRRNKNSRWSKNTLGYAKKLIKEKRMTASGLAFYKAGLKKIPNDFGLEENPKIPAELKKALEKNKKAKDNFEKLAPSYKKTYLRGIIRAKRPETIERRITNMIRIISKGKRV